MKNTTDTYAVSNDQISNQYFDTTNVVTKNSLLNILKGRAERHDDDAAGRVMSIEVVNTFNKTYKDTK